MPGRLFDDNMYRFESPQPSYWEATAGRSHFDDEPLDNNESCAVAIIGGGYTGLSAALHLAREYDIDVRVLEAGHIGWGASGRNGGFCCMGGTGVHRQDLVRMFGLDKAREYYASQVAAVELVRDLAADEGIEFQAYGRAEVEVAHSPKAFKRLQNDFELLTNKLGLQAEIVSAEECRERYYDSTEQYGALITRPAFGLHPLRYCLGLAGAANRHGARLHSHSQVIEWSKDDDGRHRLSTRGGTLTAHKVIFACNGFIQEQLRSEFFGRTIPVISAIIVTRPLTGDELAAHGWSTENPATNSRRILNYFRVLPDNRFLFGGRGDVRGTPTGEQQTYVQLEQTMRQVWPHWRHVDIDYRWHGLICMTATMCPSIGRLDDDGSIFFGFGYHGNGVDTATWVGKQLADWIGKGREPEGLPAIIRGLSRKYPFPALRMSYLKFGIFVSRQLDRFG